MDSLTMRLARQLRRGIWSTIGECCEVYPELTDADRLELYAVWLMSV